MLDGLTGLPIPCRMTHDVLSSADCPIPCALTFLPERDRFPSLRRSEARASRQPRYQPVLNIVTLAFCVSETCVGTVTNHPGVDLLHAPWGGRKGVPAW